MYVHSRVHQRICLFVGEPDLTELEIADDKGKTLSFPKETEGIRNNLAWSCAPPAPGLEDRR